MGTLFGSTPKPEPVQRMPDAEDPVLRRARRARTEKLLAESSAERARTMSQQTIAGTADTPYTARTLGGT